MSSFESDAALFDPTEWDFRFEWAPFIDPDDSHLESGGDGEAACGVGSIDISCEAIACAVGAGYGLGDVVVGADTEQGAEDLGLRGGCVIGHEVEDGRRGEAATAKVVIGKMGMIF